MDKAFITSIIIAFISGLTFLAYKHPGAFRRLYWPIFFVIFASSIWVWVWNGAINTVLSALKDFIAPAQFQAASLKAHELDFPSWYWWILTISVIYMMFLLWLPDLIADDKNKEKPKNE